MLVKEVRAGEGGRGEGWRSRRCLNKCMDGGRRGAHSMHAWLQSWRTATPTHWLTPPHPCSLPPTQFYPERKSPLARAAKLLRGKADADADADAAPAPAPPAAPAAWAAALAAATLGQQLTGAEWALLQQQLGALQGGAVVGPQCVSLHAERLATSL